MSPMAAILSLPLSPLCSSILPLSNRASASGSSSLAAQNSRSTPVSSSRCHSIVVDRTSSSPSRFLWKQHTGLRMNTEGLAKRSRDPQIAAQERAETVKKTRNYVAATINKPGVKSLIVAVAIPFVLGAIDGLANSPNTDWYFGLKKPSWQPPSFLFGGTWSILYPLMGLASWLIWAEGGFQVQGKALTLYAIQLVLNLAWPVIFFGKQNLGLALVEIVALVVAVAATVKAFQPVNHVAANLMKPYLGWVIFAAILNANLWYINRNNSTAVVEQPHAE
ncbi:translocator protein [Marchantia polymorpha subsp. ruderalis]